MNSATHEYRREVYLIKDDELPPPPTDDWHYPWELVTMAAIPGYPEELFHDGKFARMIVVWARQKGNPRDDNERRRSYDDCC